MSASVDGSLPVVAFDKSTGRSIGGKTLTNITPITFGSSPRWSVETIDDGGRCEDA